MHKCIVVRTLYHYQDFLSLPSPFESRFSANHERRTFDFVDQITHTHTPAPKRNDLTNANSGCTLFNHKWTLPTCRIVVTTSVLQHCAAVPALVHSLRLMQSHDATNAFGTIKGTVEGVLLRSRNGNTFSSGFCKATNREERSSCWSCRSESRIASVCECCFFFSSWIMMTSCFHKGSCQDSLYTFLTLLVEMEGRAK